MLPDLFIIFRSGWSFVRIREYEVGAFIAFLMAKPFF